MIIRLDDMDFHAFHGVFPQEQINGNTFRVSVELSVPDVPALQTDRLDQTLDFQLIYRLVNEQMQVRSNTLEHLAARIQSALQQQWQQAQVHVVVSKKNPPLDGLAAWATVEVD